jgi:hypothetical protein
MVVCDESESTLKETAFSCCVVLSQCLASGTRESNGNLITLSFQGTIFDV